MDMVNDILEDMKVEVTTLEDKAREIREKREEITRALTSVDRDILLIEGRLIEAKAVVSFINEKIAAQEPVEEEENEDIEEEE